MSDKIKIAINAGHYKYTAGRRCMKKFDPNETREWSLNARVAEYLEQILKEKYTGFEILRIDDRTGETKMLLKPRTDKANEWGADIWIGIHHNAGINGGNGGGVVVYRYLKTDSFTKQLQKAVYDGIVEQTGLKGNRATPLAAADLHECRETKMPAILIENGFMDSAVDTPQIIKDEFAYKSALGIAQGIAKICSLPIKPDTDEHSDDKSGVNVFMTGMYKTLYTLNLRADASLDGDILGKLPKGTEVCVSAVTSDGWGKCDLGWFRIKSATTTYSKRTGDFTADEDEETKISELEQKIEAALKLLDKTAESLQ